MIEIYRLWSFKRSLRCLTLLCFVTVVTSCSNEGATDWRKAEAVCALQRNEILTKLAHGAWNSSQCPIHCTVLLRQGISDPNMAIHENDSVYISLRRAFVKNFYALPDNLFKPHRINGEVAIIVKVFEFKEGRDFRFGPKGFDDGRLVYYSSDVETQQFLNFNNLPIYGPIRYGGDLLGLEIVMIELNNENKATESVLKTLAELGQTAYAPAEPILQALNSLGKTMLNSDHDVLLRYFVVFNPPPEVYEGLNYPVLEMGDYAFVRREGRRTETNWEDLRLNHNTGLLCKSNGKDLYRGETYLTLQILRNVPSASIDTEQNIYSKVLPEIQSEALGDGTGQVLKSIEVGLEGIIHAENMSKARPKLELLKRAQSDRSDKLYRKALAALYDLAKMVAKAEPATKKTDKLSATQAEHILDVVREALGAKEPSEFRKFELDYVRGMKALDLFTEWQDVFKKREGENTEDISTSPIDQTSSINTERSTSGGTQPAG